MRAVVQRVREADVKVGGETVSRIDRGLLVLLGVFEGDDEGDADYLVEKIVHLRIFEDDGGKMNLSLKDITGELLVVSQFTLAADVKKGRRPSFTGASVPDRANELYRHFIRGAKKMGIMVQGGVFQAMMDVSLINDGPVTFVIDSP